MLSDTKASIKDEAHKQLESDLAHLHESHDAMIRLTGEKRAELDEVLSCLEDTNKKLKTAANKLIKAGPLFNSMKHAMNTFASAQGDDYVDIHIFEVESIDSVVPPVALNCLTMKNLRSLYKQNEKNIIEVYNSYKGRYTTKANATIYRLMVLALEAEMRNILQALKFGSLDVSTDRVKTLAAKYYTIATEGNQSIAPTMQRFIGQSESLYIQAVKIEYEYYIQRESAREEQRALKEKMRQEIEEREKKGAANMVGFLDSWQHTATKRTRKKGDLSALRGQKRVKMQVITE